MADTDGRWNQTAEILTKAKNKASGSSTLNKWKQPLVSVECITSELENGTVTFLFDGYQSDMEIQSKQYPVLQNLENNNDSGGPLDYAFLDLKPSEKLPISTGMLFVSGANESAAGGPQAGDPAIELSVCLASARWVETENWIEFFRSSDTLSHFGFPRNDALFKIRQSFGTSDFININDDWMTGIASLPNTSSNRSSYEEMMYFCCNNVGCDARCLQLSLSMHLVDAMSQLGEFSERSFRGEKGYGEVDTGNNGSVIYEA
ncbi:hypothetical protein ACHAO7_011852, partial [Fusarium culmorum]